MVKKTISKIREERLEKLIDPISGKYFIVPLVDGLTEGPIEGLINIRHTIENLTKGGASAVILNKGIIRNIYRRRKRELAVVMNLSASTSLGPDKNQKVIIGNVREAVSLGAFAVSVHINIGADTEPDMLRDLGKIAIECSLQKFPLIAMVYPSGPMIDDPFDVELIKHAARVGAELGADLIITNFTGSVDTFTEVVKGCPVPILVSDGPKMTLDLEILKFVKDSISAGAEGIAISKNLFQNKNVPGITNAISKLLNENAKVEEVYKNLMEKKF